VSSDFGGPAPERLPHNHLTILEAIRSAQSGTHLTAQDVFELARRAQPKLGFATVHRGLARLTELGLVHKLDVPGASCAVYERATLSHAHFRCTRCGAIRDVEFRLPPELLAELAARHSLEIAAESTTFAGRCANCAAAQVSARVR
jgi:Fur family ferric uptake transcriptional regulator